MARLHICFLILCLHSTLATENKGHFIVPSSNDQRLMQLQNEINELKEAAQSADDFNPLKVRLATLESDFQSLKEQLEDERRSISWKIQNLENKIKEDSEKLLQVEIADEIQNRRFQAAEALLLTIAAEDKIFEIVKRVYAKSSGNIDVLIDFAIALKSSDLSVYVLCALRNNHRNPYQMIAIAKAIENRGFSQSDINSHLKNKVQKMLNETITDNISAAAETLMAAMNLEDYPRNVEVKKLSNAVGDFQLEASTKVMQRIATAASDIHSGLSALRVSDNIYSHDYMHQKISGLVALFWKFRNANDLNNEAVLSIGDYLMKLRKLSDYASINPTIKTSVDTVIENMPHWAKDLFFYKARWTRTLAFYSYLTLSRNVYSSNQSNYKLTPRELAIGKTVKPLFIPPGFYT